MNKSKNKKNMKDKNNKRKNYEDKKKSIKISLNKSKKNNFWQKFKNVKA